MAGQGLLNRGNELKNLEDSDATRRGREEHIQEFFAATVTSVYRVSSEKDAADTPIVEKIATIGRSMVPVGGRLKDGHLVGIMKSGLVLYIEDYPWYAKPKQRRQRPEEVSIGFWGGHTSEIVALCLERGDALVCLHSQNLQNCDPRWQKETEAVLELIGDNHPIFILSLTEAMTFN